MLWELKPADLSVGSSFLFGTMHVAPISIKSKLEKLQPYIENCRLFAAETNITEQKENKFESTFLPNGSIRGRLGIKKFEKLRKILLKAFKIDILQFNHLQPLVLNSLIAQVCFAGIETICPDEFLWNIAEGLGKEMTGLEPTGRELDLFERIPMKYQLDGLRAIGKNVSKFKRKLFEVGAKYENEELTTLYKSTKKGSGGLSKILLFERNDVMAENLFELSKGQPVFAAVGAAHLPGKMGMLVNLKRRGYKVKPVKL